MGRSRTPPDPDDPRKPRSPTELSSKTYRFVLAKTVRGFGSDECPDLAAALTYYAVLSLFPALLVIVSLLGVFGQGTKTTDAVLGVLDDVAPASTVDTVRPVISQLVESPSAGLALAAGLAAALWSASGYIGAFGRAMNRIYGVPEGRPFWKLRPLQVLLTLGGLILVAGAAFMLAISGLVAEAVGDAVGAGSVAMTLWSVLRWPAILLFVVTAVAALYHATPNVRQPRFRWISPGAAVAILTWIAASLLFGVYVANFSSYNTTYATLAGVVVFLLWLWITNLALLFGAELDAELERGRQLQAGMVAEEQIQLPLRDTRRWERDAAKDRGFAARARALRSARGHVR